MSRILMAFRENFAYCLLLCVVTFGFCLIQTVSVQAQDTLTGAFQGYVTDTQKNPIAGAIVRITYKDNGVLKGTKRTLQDGSFYQGLLGPGNYILEISADEYVTKTLERSVSATLYNQVIPVPVMLEKKIEVTTTPTPQPTGSPVPPTKQVAGANEDDNSINFDINTTDGRRNGVFKEDKIVSLPLGSTTLTRTFDELALLLPGVSPPPQTQGSIAGPGVGAGVGSAGQFSVNGLRSRANNFTVDGSDNNDEDIGVRRQGFFSLIPQPIESIKEFQITTLLASAQYGRNIGAQVNAISKSGGSEFHGTLYGFLNSSQLNSRNFFDTANGNATIPLRSGNQAVTLNGNPILVNNQSGDEDSFTLGQFGATLGGPIWRDRTFFFLSAERQILNATEEASFAVPTIAERGIFGSGATGLFQTPFRNQANTTPAGSGTRAFPTSLSGDAVFSLFPFPNNPTGVYGGNTFTQVLPASGRGTVFSGKIDHNFQLFNRTHTFTGRYNLTEDKRDIPVTGGAIFSALEADVRTQNFSTFLNSELSGANSTQPLFNQVRLSYGRTNLNFLDIRNNFLLPSGFRDSVFGGFGLLNARNIRNTTLPPSAGTANTGSVTYAMSGNTTEDILGPLGQVVIAGFSPIGVDVFNFPQRRVNNTYQVADTLSWRIRSHSLAFGTDIRRTELNSDLPRNFRPLLTFNGAPLFSVNNTNCNNQNPGNCVFAPTNRFIRPIDLAAGGAASGFSQILVPPGVDSHINLRYYQLNFFAQDEWRVRPRLSLTFGLRYEYNTPPRETSQKIENTFTSNLLDIVPGLRTFVEGRTSIFDPDRNNIAPRLGFAYSPEWFANRTTVIRGGYGLFYDQIPGAVVSQSRGVFPNFLTVNIPGGEVNALFGLRTFPFGFFTIVSPVRQQPGDPNHLHVQPGTLNVLNNPEGLGSLSSLLLHHINVINQVLRGVPGLLPTASAIGTVLPTKKLVIPLAHQYNFTVEQQLSRDVVFSVAYVGTLGRDLLRFSTPNLGANTYLAPLAFEVGDGVGGNPPLNAPQLIGLALTPGVRIGTNGSLTGGRPLNTVGSVSRFETTARSRYDALQVQVRGRFQRALQYQIAYTFSKATDDVSDVFDLAGAPALPQNSLTLAGENAPANFDARHRFAYNFIYDFPAFKDRSTAFRFFFGGLQVAGTGRFQTGQPFTVNSVFDVNLDGNLTDRLNSLSGIQVTGNRRQPLLLTINNPESLLAAVGNDGSVPRNSFRAGNILELDVSVIKKFALTEKQKLIFRIDIFNFINRDNFGIPVRFLESPGFGQATDTVTPGRRIQFVLKFEF